jgi:hypothetical protein
VDVVAVRHLLREPEVAGRLVLGREHVLAVTEMGEPHHVGPAQGQSTDSRPCHDVLVQPPRPMGTRLAEQPNHGVRDSDPAVRAGVVDADVEHVGLRPPQPGA